MISLPPVSEISQLEASLCFALADPVRILMLYALDERPHNVSELSSLLSLSQPSTSRQLKVLRERGLVATDRQGVSIIYRLTDRRLIQALDLLRGVLHDQIAHHVSLLEEINVEHAPGSAAA
ncbi:MAG: winged helix-turn-helix transcriptional regulator [Chloroflexi bacterium]|jgi:DNA-binding transcriptional ArsR family regulator|nr:winged helix-turn-helix transcriptional regulator [Chloroflexota bacterium]